MALEGVAAAYALAPIGFVGALIHGVTGFGASLLNIPLATYFVSLPFALAVFSIVDFVNVLWLGLQNPRKAALGECARMVLFMIFGIILGTTLLVNIPRRAGLFALGAFLLGYALFQLMRRESSAIVGKTWGFVAGFFGGLIGTLFGPGSAPYAVYLSHRPLDKEQFRATLTLTSVFNTGFRLLAYLVTGLVFMEGVFTTAAATLPASLLGTYLATWLFRLISRETLMRAVALLLCATGISLVVRALA
jgi:uncharacterized protein